MTGAKGGIDDPSCCSQEGIVGLDLIIDGEGENVVQGPSHDGSCRSRQVELNSNEADEDVVMRTGCRADQIRGRTQHRHTSGWRPACNNPQLYQGRPKGQRIVLFTEGFSRCHCLN